MDLSDIEANYERDLGFAKDEFLKDLNDKISLNDAEKQYREKLKSAKEQYYSSISRNLKKQKISVKTPNEFFGKKQKIKPFNVKEGGYNLTFLQRLKVRFHLKFFHLSFKFRNFRRKHTPDFISYPYIKFKMDTKRAFVSIKDSLEKFIGSGEELFKSQAGLLKNFLANTYKKAREYIKKVWQKLMEKVGRKSKGEKGGGNKVEGEEKEEKKSENEKEGNG